MDENSMKIVMYPWFAMGHFIPFLHIANKLAERNQEIVFICPIKTQSKLQEFNLHPNLIKFMTIDIPQVDGLPFGAETTADIHFQAMPFLRVAMDLTRPVIDTLLQEIKPHVVFHDFQHWLPMLAHQVGAISVFFSATTATTIGYTLGHGEDVVTDTYLNAPRGYPSPDLKLSKYEVQQMCGGNTKAKDGEFTFMQSLVATISFCDAIFFRTIREIEGYYTNYIEQIIKKPVLLAGLFVPEMPAATSLDEEKWAIWLNKFKPKSVVFCSFGSEARLKNDQFQEMLSGLELTGFPFIAAFKPPVGFETIEEALPYGFESRIQERGMVHDGWVPQQLILSHKSIGCFVTHCGTGSVTEALVTECKMVLLPHHGDQFIFARALNCDLKVGVEIETGYEDGKFTKGGVFKAINSVMDEENEIGKMVGENHAKLRHILLKKGFEIGYIDEFVEKMQALLHMIRSSIA